MSGAILRLPPVVRVSAYRTLVTTARRLEDPRLDDLGKVIDKEYAFIRDNYGASTTQSGFMAPASH